MRSGGWTLEDPAATPLPRCAECGHMRHMHVENGTTQRSKPGDPVPCFAVIDEYTLIDGTGVHLGTRYDLCGCEALIHAAALV